MVDGADRKTAIVISSVSMTPVRLVQVRTTPDRKALRCASRRTLGEREDGASGHLGGRSVDGQPQDGQPQDGQTRDGQTQEQGRWNMAGTRLSA
eukprot:329677-Chlamydomonas_euryale.AAC.10